MGKRDGEFLCLNWSRFFEPEFFIRGHILEDEARKTLEREEVLTKYSNQFNSETQEYQSCWFVATLKPADHPNGTIKQYLDWLAVYDIQDEMSDEAENLTLCTIHASKGLEFGTVLLAGCNEGIIPSKQAIAAGEIEEERRLFYVGITRARDQLLLCVRPERKEVDGKVYESPTSRFVGEAQGDKP
jgi:superfamily I DNA/RNA helicase